MRAFRLVVLATLWTGCVGDEHSFEFGGSFTETATQADIADFQARMKARGADDVLIMESFPAQFRVAGLDEDCEGARAEADALAYVRSVSDCRETHSEHDGDEPVSTTNSDT